MKESYETVKSGEIMLLGLGSLIISLITLLLYEKTSNNPYVVLG